MDRLALEPGWAMFDAPGWESCMQLHDGNTGDHLAADYTTIGSSSPVSSNYLAYLVSTLASSESCSDTGPLSCQGPNSAATTIDALIHIPSNTNNYQASMWGVDPIQATRAATCSAGRRIDSTPKAHEAAACLKIQQAIHARAQARRVANITLPAGMPMHSSVIRPSLPSPGYTACTVSAVGGTAAVLAGLHPRVEAVPGLGSPSAVCAAGAELPTASLYVKNLPTDADELMLYRIFSPCGPVLSCRVHTDPATGACRGVGFVNYADAASARRALMQLQGVFVAEGRMLSISLQAPRAIRAAAAAVHAAQHYTVNTA